MKQPLTIDFVSDISCSWCAIALSTIEQTLSRIESAVAPIFHFHAFELNPQMPIEGQSLVEHMGEKYGLDQSRVERHFEYTRVRGKEVGFIFNQGLSSQIYNTFDAHRLLYWAALKMHGYEFKTALFEAYFTRGRNPSDYELLLELVSTIGLNVKEAECVLVSNEYALEVRRTEKFWGRMSVRAVPTIVFNGGVAISGCQSAEAFESIIDRVLIDSAALIENRN